MYSEFELKIGKMTCANCANAIERTISNIKGVKKASVSYVSGGGIFLAEKQLKDEIIAKIKTLGFEVLKDDFELEKFKENELKKLKINLILSIILNAFIMYFEMFVKNELSNFIQLFLSVIAIFYCGRDFFIHAYKGILSKNLDMNTLVALGSFSAFFYSFLAFFNLLSGANSLYFGSGAMIICFILIGKNIEENIKIKASEYQKKLAKISVLKAKILQENNEILELNANLINAGDILVLREGDSVSSDGMVLSGDAELDVSFLNGEFMPVCVRKNDEVMAGALVISGEILVKATQKAMDSTLARLKNLVFHTQSVKTPLISLTNKISAYFVAIILCLSLFTGLLWSFLSDFESGFLHALSVLLISCPCALGLATPLALSAAFSVAAKNFILTRKLEAFEKFKDIKSVIFDKTGTLTKNELEIFKHNLSDEDFKTLAFIESFSSHPIAKALSKNVLKRALKSSEKLEIMPSNGVKFQNANDEFLLGNANFMLKNNINVSLFDDFLKENEKEAQICVYFAKNQQCLGLVLLKNDLKNGAKELIQSLKNQNINSIILSGDNEKSVSEIAKKLDISEFYANFSASEKLDFIKNHQNAMFVGDGLNDSAALSGAKISVSFAQASELTKSAGDFILIKDELKSVDFLIKLSKKTRLIIKQNLFWAFFYNALCIPLAAGAISSFALSPHFAALAMSLSSIFVVLNSLRLRYFKLKN